MHRSKPRRPIPDARAAYGELIMAQRACLALVLAAGEGTRMRSERPKVLHLVAGRSLLGHVLAAAAGAGADRLAAVIGPAADGLAAEVRAAAPGAVTFVQAERRGTAHAVLAARQALADGAPDVLVLFGDTPLVRAETLRRLRERLAGGAAVVVLGFRAVDPTGYGRLIVDDGALVAIREERDAAPDERAIDLCNGGIMALSGAHALELLDAVGDDNAKREFYLTDVVGIARAKGLAVDLVEADEEEVQGVNTRAQLAAVEAAMQQRLRSAAMEAGATLVAPETVHLAFDTKIGRDVVVEPYVVFAPGVEIGDDVVIHSFCHLDGARIGAGASVGPFARLRPGTRTGERVRIGNFVETKAADIADGAKINHLSYVGDSSVGARANIGAGTITCNYDGAAKHRTEIGADAFIGSNSALVAPVSIGEGAYVGTGSVITDDVPADALAIARGRQVVKENRAAEMRAARKKAGSGSH
jgi:bifunctional UDP-N-acetylglucosamine pyrophosphorylase/glucosamine-1-phosphate N-acetyltransferase